MKASIKIVLASSALALGIFSPVIFAQEEPPPPPQGEERGDGFENPQERFLAMLTDNLSLTQEQQTKIAAVLADEKAAMDALRTSQSTDREADHTKIGAIIKAHREQIRALLTTEQQSLFDALKPAGHPGHGHGAGGPPPDQN
jgi:periplasmic protein CpxP/Spy